MATETESRYVVPDRALFNRLLEAKHLGPFSVQPRGTVKITDHYLDTRGRALLRQGWACRLRAQDGTWTVNVKGPKQVEGPAVVRAELETPLPERVQDYARWPAGPTRKRVQELTGGIPLQTLVTINQTRHVFTLVDGSRQVGQLSLDAVRTQSKDVRHRSYMLEWELVPEGA